MKTLGINISHDFSTCVYENNIIKDIWYEERFNFHKYWHLYDEKFENYIISIFKKINFKPDLVCYSSFQRSPFANMTDEKIINFIQKQLDNPPHFFDKNKHHIYHAINSFYFSKEQEAMGIVIDGGGAQPFNNNYQEMESIFYLNKKIIFLLYQHLSNRRFIKTGVDIENYSNYSFLQYNNNTEYEFSSQSVGGFDFGRVCQLTKNLGLRDEKDAGKLMGLSSYFYSNFKYDLDYDNVELAKNVQEKSFNRTCALIEKAYDYKKIKNFVLSGGYFLNCTNNFKYVKKYPEFNFFVDPIPHDGGTAIGACIYYDKYK